LFAEVGQLRREHGTLFQFHNGHSVGSVCVKAGRGLVNGGVRINLAFAAKSELFFCFIAAIRAYITRWKDFMVAVGTNLAYESVSLFLESPMSWDFHVLLFLSMTVILSRATLKDSQGRRENHSRNFDGF
jgi:hypothetical protein